MRRHRLLPKWSRIWRSRRFVWRVALVLVLLCFFSLLTLFWSFSLDGQERESRGQGPVVQPPPPPPYDQAGDGDAEGDGFVQVRRPLAPGGNKNRPPSSPTAPPILSADQLWFSDGAALVGGRAPQRVYHADGVARVVLESGNADPTAEAVTLPLPRLLASNVSWDAYERFIKSTGAEVGGPHAPVEAAGHATYLRPVRQVEVQLLRSRVARSTWAAAAPDVNAIVGVVPLESSLLASAEELLVEHHLRAEDRRNPSPDPSHLLPLSASTVHGNAEEAEWRGGALRIDVAGRPADRLADMMVAAAAAEEAATTTTTPLVELRRVHRVEGSEGLVGAGAASKGGYAAVTPTTTQLKWRAGDAHAVHPTRIDITLDVVEPRRSARGDGARGAEAAEEVVTDALQATLCSPRLVRLYGLSLHDPQQHRRRHHSTTDTEVNTAASVAGDDDFIPLHMVDEIEMMVGGPLASSSTPSAFSRAAGVVPLLYLELNDGGSVRRTVGVLWLHPAPFMVSTLTDASSKVCVRLRSTAGATRLYLLPGPTPADVLRQYYTLTGFPTLPQRFLLGYHHGLRGAAASTDVAVEALDTAFLRSRVPLDSVWAMDTAVAARDTPFTWNTSRFPDAVRLQANLWHGGRRYVVVRTVPTIPITSRSPLFVEGRREGYFVSMNAEASDGWPTHSIDGIASHVVDFANPSARRWYGNMLKYRRYAASTNHTFIALRHGAPAVLSTDAHNPANPACVREAAARLGDVLPMEVGHHGSFAHREVHQLLSVGYARSAHEGLLRRTQYVRRALVLTESFYAGIQRYAVVQVEASAACGAADAVAAGWSQLRSAVRQCAQLSVLGIPFSGANLGAGLTQELVQLLPLRTATEAPNADEDAQEGEEHKEQLPLPSPRAGRLSPSSLQLEVEALLRRWYQAGLFLTAMYTVEDATKAAAAAAALPWWMRLPVTVATKEAVEATVRVRYALMPYLYTVAYQVSERGTSFFAPLSFTHSTEAADGATHNASAVGSLASLRCYAAGEAVVVCPVTSATAANTSQAHRVGSAGLFDLWTGVWNTTGQVDSAAAAAVPLRWLAMSGGGVHAPPLPTTITTGRTAVTSAALPPAFLRPRYIVATQNVVESSSAGGAADAPALHSTHMGTNWTITVALPPLPTRTTAASTPVLLAEGEVYWDEGSRNSQQRPPAPPAGGKAPLSIAFPVIPQQPHHCLLRLRCFYESQEDAATITPAARLVVEVSQTSGSCAEALAELQAHWREEPQGFAEQLARAAERRDARVHAREVEQNAKEDEGQRRARPNKGGGNATSTAEPFTEEDLKGLRLPRWSADAAPNELSHSHLLHRIRFLFQREEDSARLTDLYAAPNSPAVVVVERQGRGADTEMGNSTTVSGSARASRSSPHSHEVQIDLADYAVGNHSAPERAAMAALATTSLFGVVRPAEGGGEPSLHVPPSHSWRFVFPLD